MKECVKCGVKKTLNDFNKNVDNKDKLRGICKKCQSDYSKQYRKDHKEELKEKRNIYRQAHRKEALEYQRTHRKELFGNHLRRTYKLNLAEVEEMFEKQKGKCLICKDDMHMEGRNGTRAHVDHNHNDGKIRGLICDRCNRGLGLFRENTQSLQNAIEYLK